MTGVDIAVGYVFAWLVRKARRVGGRADADVDRGLDAAMNRLHDLVSRKLGADPALERAAEEAEEGRPEPSALTRRRLADSLADAVARDLTFARALREFTAQVQAVQAAASGAAVTASGSGQAVGGSVGIRADGGSAAAWTMGDVTIGGTANPPAPGPEQG